jgi:shikimate kinase
LAREPRHRRLPARASGDAARAHRRRRHERGARLAALLAERKSAYESAHIAVDTDEASADALVAELAQRIRRREAA